MGSGTRVEGLRLRVWRHYQTMEKQVENDRETSSR